MRIVYRANVERVTLRAKSREIHISTGSRRVNSLHVPVSVFEIVEHLRLGGFESEDLLNFISSDDTRPESERAMLCFTLQSIADADCLFETIQSADRKIVTALSRGFALSGRVRDSETGLQLSRTTHLRSDLDGPFIDSASGSPVYVHDPSIIPAIFRAGATVDISEYTGPGAAGRQLQHQIERVLLESRLLVSNSHPEAIAAEWQFHDLIYHAKSDYFLARYSILRPSRSAHRRFAAEDGMQSRFPETKVLQPPIRDAELKAVFDHRRSTRDFEERPISLTQLSDFLSYTAGATSREDLPGRTGRPYPAAGALYELSIYVVANDCRGLARGLYKFNPEVHALRHLADFDGYCDRLVRHASAASEGARVQVLIVISAQFEKVLRKYPGFGYSLILKDVGVVLQTFYIAAAAMNLGICALGGGDRDAFRSALGLDPLVESAVGEVILGSIGSG